MIKAICTAICQLLAVGQADLMAALTAAKSGLRVILADEDFCLGGRLNAETAEIDGVSSATVCSETLGGIRLNG